MIYGYVRVSTKDQNAARQISALMNEGVDEKNLFVDRKSGKDFQRKRYQSLLRKIKPGDVIFIKELDRLGRNYTEIIENWRLITVEKQTDEMVFRNEQVATTDFKVTKVWQNGNEGAISLTLYANGRKLEPQPACNRSGDTYTYTGLPMYDAKGNPIQYAAKERPVSGYMTIYKNVAPYESESSFIYDGGTIINRAVTQIAVRKVWKGMDEGKKRPDIKLTLYCKL